MEGSQWLDEDNLTSSEKPVMLVIHEHRLKGICQVVLVFLTRPILMKNQGKASH